MPCGTCGKDVRTPRQWLACREHFVADIKRLKMEVEGLERFRDLRTRHGQELADRTTQLANAQAELSRYEEAEKERGKARRWARRWKSFAAHLRCERQVDGAQVARLRMCALFFSSVIKSGEPWTEECETSLKEALARSPDER